MNLPQNLFDGDISIQTFLCQPDKTIIGEIMPYEYKGTFKFNTYSEISFTIDRWYNDLIDGTTKVNPYYDLVESLRVIYLKGIGHFAIQDVDENNAENDSKSVTCFSLEYSTGQKYLENFYVNTGAEGSIETMYHAQKHGAEYSIDNYYEIAKEYNPYRRYYIKEYSNDNGVSYNYVEKQVLDENDFNSYDGSTEATTLYKVAYPNVQFYDPYTPELSLLHNVFSRIPEWKIGHVDKELWYQERTFEEQRTAVYDFLYNTAAETLDFVMVWDSINGVCSFYKTTEDGVTADEEIETQWDTDVFISRENLASSIDIKYSTDDIKTKLKITGSDDLDIRDVNLGQNYILNLSYYNTPDWLGEDLYKKYNKYTDVLEDYTAQYKELISDWSATYHSYSDLMNHVPAEPRVMLVGDEFDKLYCTYSPSVIKEYVEDKEYYSDMNGTVADPQPTSQEDIDSGKYYTTTVDKQAETLRKKLNTYKVDQQNTGVRSQMAKTEDVLLTLEDKNSNSAVIRVRYDVDDTNSKPSKEAYRVYRTLTTAATGAISTEEYLLTEWLDGSLTAEKMGLSGYAIKSIGTLGAYLCLVRDETVPENIEDYGIRLLEEKQDTYTKIFITQTEGYMSKEGYQSIASDKDPAEFGEVAVGTKWLDTDSDPLTLYIREADGWKEIEPEEGAVISSDASHSADYERYLDNYNKLQTVQSVLLKKQKQATYLLNGVAIDDRYLDSENINAANLISVAAYYFNVTNEEIEKLTEYNQEFGYITFTISSDKDNKYAVYVVNGTPYISYVHSQGLCFAKMNVIKVASDMKTFFTEGELIRLSPFIREDEYSDDNFLLTGYESEEEQMHVKQELLNAGIEELEKICQPKLSFDTSMANILAIPEFEPIKKQFRLGNFVKVGIREGYVKRARLLEVSIDFDDPSDFSSQFGDLISTKSEIDKHADLLSMAVQAGKSVASNSSNWQKGADKATALDKAINEGLKDAALSIGSTKGQSIIWDEYGIKGRKLKDGTTNQYEDEQFALINNKLVFTDDAWKTSKGVFGKFEVDGVTHWGVLSDAVISGYIEGSVIKGGQMEIGGSKGKFVVHEDGSVEILAGEQGVDGNAYVTTETYNDGMNLINSARQYHTELSYSGSTIFTEPNQSVIITCKIYNWDEDITDKLPRGTQFKWIRSSSADNTEWNSSHIFTDINTITITNDDVVKNAQFNCQITFDETQLS